MRKNFGKKTYLYPLPVLIVAAYDSNGNANAMTVAWGTICDYNKVELNLSLDHKTCANMKETNAFTISFATKEFVKEADYLGIVSGNEVANKLDKCNFTVIKSEYVNAPIIEQFPVTLECSVDDYIINGADLTVRGSIINVSAEEEVLDIDGNIDVEKMNILSYNPFVHTYVWNGKNVAKAFACGKEIK